jgi:hypothetical protein
VQPLVHSPKDWAAGPWHPWLEVTPSRVFILRYPPNHSYEGTVGAFDDIVRISAAATSPYAFIFDVTRMTRSDARGRAYVTECEKKINPMQSVKTHCRGVAWVSHNALQRGVLTAIAWFASRPYEEKVLGSYEDADRWIASRLGIPPTAFSAAS